MTVRKRARAGPHESVRGTGHPRRAPTPGVNDLVEATLRTRIPDSLPWGSFFARHPEERWILLNRIPVSRSEIVAEFRVEGDVLTDWSKELGEIPNVKSVQRLHRSGRPEMYRLRWAAPSFYIALLEEFDFIGMVPFTITENRASLTIALPRKRLRRLMAAFRNRKFDPELLQVRPFRGRPERGDLTPKQKARFRAAVESGYFDVPRRVTLGELATRFSVRKSALAESLAHARRKVLLSAGKVLLADSEGSLPKRP